MVEHPFQRAGLGLAPFKCMGVEEKTYQACPGAPVQPGGSCDYCGTGIRYMVHVLSADNNRFKIGMDCAQKLYKESNTKIPREDSVARAIREHKNELARASRERRELELIRRLSAELASIPNWIEALKAIPHSAPYWAAQGETAWTQLNWFIEHAGRTGHIKAMQTALTLLAKKGG